MKLSSQRCCVMCVCVCSEKVAKPIPEGILHLNELRVRSHPTFYSSLLEIINLLAFLRCIYYRSTVIRVMRAIGHAS